LKAIAIDKCFADHNGLAPGAKATAIIGWLKVEYNLAHDDAMSIVAYLKGKRN
jgi:hypothetical protein